MSKQSSSKTWRTIFSKKFVLILVCIGLPILSLTIYGLTNFMLHRASAYTNLHIGGMSVGDQTLDEVYRAANQHLKDVKITFRYGQQTKEVRATEAGVSVDRSALEGIVNNPNPLPAFLPWFFTQNATLPIATNTAKLEVVLATFKTDSFKTPKDATFTVENDKLFITKDVPGYGIDAAMVSNVIATELSTQLKDVSLQLSASRLNATVTKADIEKQSNAIKKHLTVDYQIIALDSITRPSKKDIAGWLDIKNGKVVVDTNAIRTFIDTLAKMHNLAPIDQVTSLYKSGKPSAVTTIGRNGRTSSNLDDVTKALVQSVSQAKPLKIEILYVNVPFKQVTTLVDDTVRFIYTYDVAVWGTVGSDLATFKALVAQTFADSRGWAAAGISFQEVASGGSFTLVLAEPSYVGAQPGCSSYWSCRSGRYVIINDARWTSATDTWNAAGGGLRDYRHMVVNHESGHWLGFDHRSCPGPGQPAPVMLQQSIDLQGCAFNPWPTVSEIASL